MLSDKLMTLALIAVYLVLIDSADSSVKCQGEVKNGKLELTLTEDGMSNVTGSNHSSTAQRCTVLTIEFNTETSVDWKKTEKPSMPKLIFLTHNLTNPNWTTESEYIRDLSWKNFSIFGHQPRDVAQLEYSISVYLGHEEIFYFAPMRNTLEISGLDPHPFFNKFKDQNILIKTLTIKNNKLDNDLAGFKIPDGIESLWVENVEIKNLTRLIEKLESLEILSLNLNLKKELDISEILKVSKNLTALYIWNSNLTFKDSTVQLKSLRFLIILNCNLDSEFMRNAWRGMPNLEDLKLELNSTKFDIGDLSPNKHLSALDIRFTKVTFTKPAEKFLALATISFVECEFDSTFGVDTWSAFPNLRHVFGFPGWRRNIWPNPKSKEN